VSVTAASTVSQRATTPSTPPDDASPSTAAKALSAGSSGAAPTVNGTRPFVWWPSTADTTFHSTV
jgi:hypothetical protein